MAKMMTTEVAFELIGRGQLQMDKMCTVRPETWRQWHGPQAGSTMFLSPNEQVSIENLLHGIVTLSGNDASVVLAECIAGTEQAFVEQMNALASSWGSATAASATRSAGRTRAAPTLRRATSRRSPGRRSSATPSSTSNSMAGELHLGQDPGLGPGDHPGQPQPDPRQGPRCGRAEDRPHPGSRLRLHRLGRAERAAADRGRRRPE
jgi:hypothetical protein